MKAKVKETGEIIDVEQYECDHFLGWNYMDWDNDALYWEYEIEILEKPREREMGKFVSIDASGVKEIAEMQEYIDYLENNIWRLFMFTRGQDDCQSLAVFEKFKGEMSQFAMEGLYDFIKEHKEEKK